MAALRKDEEVRACMPPTIQKGRGGRGRKMHGGYVFSYLSSHAEPMPEKEKRD